MALLVAAGLLSASADVARADEIGIFALAGAYNTDNALRSNESQRHDSVTYLTLATYGKWETGRLRTSWGIAEDAVKYLNGSFGSKAYGSAAITADYNAIPELMVWHARENYGQLLVNPTLPDTPLNRANFNVFSTGPSFHIPLTQHTWAGAEGSYSNTYYEGQTLNGDKFDTEVSLNRNLGYKTDLGAVAGQTEGKYKAFGKFKTQSAALRFVTTGAFTQIKVDGGLNRATLPVRTDNLPFFDFSINRKTETGSSFDLKLQRKITNPSEQFGQIAGGGSAGIGNTGGGVGGAIDLSTQLNLFESKIARVSFLTKRRRTEVQVGLSYRKEDTLPGAARIEHRRIESVDAMYHRIWGSKTGIVVYGSYELHHGELFADREDHEFTLGTEIAKPLGGPGLRWVITVEHRRRTSNDSLNEYKELRIGAYLRYSKFIYNRQLD
jgi:hypothetical protein